MRKLLVIAAAAATLLATPALAAATVHRDFAGAAKAAGVNRLVVTTGDYVFRAPKTTPAGWTKVIVKNKGIYGHQVQVARLKPGTTWAALKAAANADKMTDLMALVEAAGGPNGAAPGGTANSTVNLRPGRYALLCFIPSDEGKSHFAMGMYKALTVTKATKRTAPPKAEGTIDLKDFGFTPPPVFTGRGTYRITNSGAQDHELAFFSVAEGKTFADAKASILVPPGGAPPAGPPPVSEAPGVVGVRPGGTAYITIDFDPGQYVMACFFPDMSKGGIPHVAEGMYQELTIPTS